MMNATASPLLQPLCDSLTAIARTGDRRALRAHLEGRGLPLIGSDTEPAELILRALGEMPDAPRLAFDLAPPLAQVIAECMAELGAEEVKPILRLLLQQALRLAADLPANAALAGSLRDLAISLEEAASDFWHQNPLAPLLAKALVYQQTDAQTEPLWLRLLGTSGEGPWTPERRTVLLSAWRGLLHVPPNEEAARVGRVIDMDRVERGLLALEAGVRSRDGGPRLVRQALRVLAETFPRSPRFWEERLADPIGRWPTELQDEVVRQWPGVEDLAGTVRRKAAAGTERPFVEPRTPVEQELVEIWCELLGVDTVSIYDNFLELGGDSIRVSQLAARIRTTFGVELPIQALFAMADVVEMTQAIYSEAAHKAATTAQQAQQMEEHEIAALLAELEALSDEEIQALLEARDKERRWRAPQKK